MKKKTAKDISALMQLRLEDYVCMLARRDGATAPKLEETCDGDMVILDRRSGRVFAIKIDEIV